MTKQRLFILTLITLSALFLFSSCSSNVKMQDDEFSYMEGVWYKNGAKDNASLTFYADGSWVSTASDGSELGKGYCNIYKNNRISMYNSDGEYETTLIVHSKNKLTLGDSGTEYIRGSSLK